MKIKNKIIISLLLLIGILTISGCGCKQTNPKQYTLNLEIWGLFDDRDAFDAIIENYKKLNPNIGEISYKKLTPDTYKRDLLDALASGQGPDIFLIQNHWLPSFGDKVYPAPATILNEQQYKASFADVAAQDFLSQGYIYAAPLSIDSLALFYNKDLFNAAGITTPPRDWSEFVADSRKLTRIDSNGQIVYSGAAMGRPANAQEGAINRATDILNLLMLQAKTEMIDEKSGRATFDQVTKLGNENLTPGQNALNFYTQFADRGSSLYSWNSRMHNSIDAFSEGSVGMMFNYSWQVDVISSKAPKLNFGVAPVPQFAGNPPVDYPNYWAYAVAKNKTPDTHGMDPATAALVTQEIRIGEAWKFLTYLTVKSDPAAIVAAGQGKVDPNFDPAADYLMKTKKPAARRDLIEQQKTDPKLGVFAQGNLIAKDWLQADPDAVENIFNSMIDQVNRGQSSIQEALKAAAINVSQVSGK